MKMRAAWKRISYGFLIILKKILSEKYILGQKRELWKQARKKFKKLHEHYKSQLYILISFLRCYTFYLMVRWMYWFKCEGHDKAKVMFHSDSAGELEWNVYD